jgi:hypothetical protein
LEHMIFAHYEVQVAVAVEVSERGVTFDVDAS